MNDSANPTVLKKKEASKSALLSAVVIPGAGQMYNREWIKGLFISVIFTVSSLCLLIPITYAVIVYSLGWSDPASPSFQPVFQDADPFTLIKERQLSFITLLVVSIILYVYAILDAYQARMKM